MMNTKQKQIIESAVKLFADKGFHLTSMQEIAAQIGISKGSLYLHFESKEQLLLSIVEYYQVEMLAKVACVAKDTSLAPKEKLIKQVYVMFDEFQSNGDFVKMQVKEQLNHNSKAVKEFMLKKRAKLLTWHKKALLSTFGEQIRPYLWDFVTIFHGIISEYMRLFVLEKGSFNLKVAATFMVNRLENMIQEVLDSQPEGVVSQEMMGDIETAESGETELPEIKMSREIDKVSERIQHLPLSQKHQRELTDVVDYLREEIESKTPRASIIKAMLTHLSSVEALSTDMKRLRALMEIQFDL
jgi:AcrR family transcriptional regulator